jgi:putative nucleotidyltransferase with HDIG domain
MSTSVTYASSLSHRIDQAKWNFGLPEGARRLIANGDFQGRDNAALLAWLAKDPVLAARLLRWCNSPLFNDAAAYESLSHAIAAIDPRQLSRLAVLAFVRSLFPAGQLIDGVPRDRLWGHSIAVAAVSSMISQTCGRGDPSLVFVAGALHDIGLCANQRLAAESHAAVVAEVDHLSPAHEVELDLWGWDHTQLGEAILRQWGLPEGVVGAARYHHSGIDAIKRSEAETIVCVSIANFLCSRVGWSSLGHHSLPPPGNESLAVLGINAGRLAVIWQGVGAAITAASELI